MGYTLYFDYAKQPTIKEMKAFQKEAKKVLKAFGVESVNVKKSQELDAKLNELIDTKADQLYRYYKPKMPINHCTFAVFYQDAFMLYGPHETLQFDASDTMNIASFCKTARKSYDILCKILTLLAEKHLPIKFVYHDGQDFDFLIDCLDSASDEDQEIAAKLVDELSLCKEGMMSPSGMLDLAKNKDAMIATLKSAMV